MGSKSSIQIVDHPNGKTARVQGVIDGTFDLRPLMGEHEIVLFDLGGVERITSFGVREWRTTLSRLRPHYLGFVRCHPSLVSQFNLVPGFACGGELISFYLPYICPSCNHVAESLLDLRNDDSIVESLQPPEVRCPKCSMQMEFDDIPAAYFKYARSVPQPRPPAAANAMIDDRPQEAPRRELSVRKEVEDTVTAFWLAGDLDDKRALRRLTEGIEGDVVVVLNHLGVVNDDGLAGLFQFLKAAGDVYLCRVPEEIAVALLEGIDRQRLLSCRIVSVELTAPCPGCGKAIHLELDAPRLTALVDTTRTPFDHCSACGHQVDGNAVPRELLDAVRKTGLTDPPEAVQVYLRNRGSSPGASMPGGHTYTAPSQLLFGNYRILKQLGEGGMGEVLLARYVGAEKFEKLVVLKRIRRDYLRNPDALKEFQREARVSARLSHPNIVQIFDFSKQGDEYFFAMEYVNGIDLRQALRLCRDADMMWPAALCMRVASDVCSGLEAAHDYVDDAGNAVPIYHRDVSPENVIISVDGAVKLTDFGIAKAADSSVNTDSGVFKGKHAYSAPEYLEADVNPDHRGDIYAAGIVLFEVLSLRRFFGPDPTLGAVYAATKKPPPLLRDEREDVPDGLQEIFERSIATNPADRYQSAREFKDSLERLMKRGEYPTNHDLAAWIRKILTLQRLADDREPTPGTRRIQTPPSATGGGARGSDEPARTPVSGVQTAVENVQTSKEHLLRVRADDDG